MWKVVCLLAAVGLVAGLDEKKSAENNTSILGNSSSTTTMIPNIILGDKESVVVNLINKEAEAEPGSAGNPFDPPDLVKLDDAQSLSSFKYYFVILVVSSLSVIAVIIFKTLR